MNKQSMQSSAFTNALHVDSTARVSDKHGCRTRRSQKFVLRQACRREVQRSILISC